MSLRGGPRRFTCGSRGRNGTENPEQVTCANCRRLLGLGETWAQQHGRTVRKPPVRVDRYTVNKSTGKIVVGVEVNDAHIARAFKLANLLILARTARAAWMHAKQEDKNTAALNMADVLKGFLNHFEEKDTH